jgi:UDP-N-acetylmuramoyl-tripeptide--D-alanyl-D-alanine ligase
MKKFFKLVITKLLAFRAKQILKKNHVQVIAVTGSVGKTTTKEAMFAVVDSKFNARTGTSGFNTELGVALTILQEPHSGFSSPIEWLKILKRAFTEKKPKFQKVVLEMGADTKGDIHRLVKLASPHIGVITNVNPVHLGEGQFKDIYEIAAEKNNLIRFMTPHDTAILNADDKLVMAMETKAKKITYGVAPEADLRAENIHSGAKELKYTVHYKDKMAEVAVPVLGAYQIYTTLPAIAVGLALGMTLEKSIEGLKHFKMPAGRMNPIEGVNDSIIIDSSYNASPTAVAEAFNVLHELKSPRKIVALGTMNELGALSKEAHLQAGHQAAQVAQVLIFIGPEASTMKQGALEAGFDEKAIFTFLDSEEAGHFLKGQLQPKDLVLAKGSQNKVRLEKLVKIIMAEPQKAKELLCRQEEAWKKI